MKFTELPLIDELQTTIKKQGYVEATPIQEQAIPALLAGKDVLGTAQTGTGKTAAFGLPLLQHIAEHPVHVKPYHARALILAPTRELAAQIDKDLRTYGRLLKLRHACIFGGVGQKPQENAMKKGVDILVATPGRLLDLERQRYIKLQDVEYFVLDEADRMLDMGFLPDMKTIIKHMGPVKQKLLFSATMATDIENLANNLLDNPVRIDINPEATTAERVEQHVLYVDPDNKNPLLITLVKQEALDHVLVFTRTKHRADRLARLLKKKGVRADSIHGDKSQTARTKALTGFRNKTTNVLIATEIAARGLDVRDITHVINFDVPEDPESYIHRIGRTARAGATGTSYLFCTAREKSLLLNIEQTIGKKLLIINHQYHSTKAEESTTIYKRTNRRSQQRTTRNHHHAGQRRRTDKQPRTRKTSEHTQKPRKPRGETRKHTGPSKGGNKPSKRPRNQPRTHKRR